MAEIPVIAARAVMDGQANEAIMAGATGSGFLTLSGVDDLFGLAPHRRTMLSFFSAGEDARSRTLRNKYDPARPNVYRGHFPVDLAGDLLLEGFDIGPDIADPPRAGDGADPLTEPTPRPGLPGWDGAVATYYRALEDLGLALTRAIFAGLGARPDLANRWFANGISSLRLLHYPEHPAEHFHEERRITMRDGITRYLMTGAHTDSGFVTLLWQDDTGGLQAQTPDGTWLDVPPATGGLVVNFGQMLGDWSGSRIKATPHRVLGGTAQRFSVPFFFEPAVDARITPLTGQGEGFIYGDFLWERMLRFPNMRGLVRKAALTG